MKVVEASGSAREIGRATGEALREDIREHLERHPFSGDPREWQRRLPRFLGALARHLPKVLEEMEGTAEGADVPLNTVSQLNLPLYPDSLCPEQECTNIAFAGGPDGPVWGKNNDGMSRDKRRPPCARVVRRDDGIPLVIFTFCGMLATTDAMNAEGVAVGHSSVGSIFQQSDDHVPIRLWAYECLMRSRSTVEFVRNLAGLPTRDKGYSHVCVDRNGVACSIEAPCPVLQVRWPEGANRHINCTNYYQLPTLANADRRSESGKRNAHARRLFLDAELSSGKPVGLADMKRLLRHHGEPSLCRHGARDDCVTEYSMIGLPRSGKVLYLDGLPCEEEYSELAI
jgi:hypothetical protein